MKTKIEMKIEKEITMKYQVIKANMVEDVINYKTFVTIGYAATTRAARRMCRKNDDEAIGFGIYAVEDNGETKFVEAVGNFPTHADRLGDVLDLVEHFNAQQFEDEFGKFLTYKFTQHAEAFYLEFYVGNERRCTLFNNYGCHLGEIYTIHGTFWDIWNNRFKIFNI